LPATTLKRIDFPEWGAARPPEESGYRHIDEFPSFLATLQFLHLEQLLLN
jgi:hypothetical protein